MSDSSVHSSRPSQPDGLPSGPARRHASSPAGPAALPSAATLRPSRLDRRRVSLERAYQQATSYLPGLPDDRASTLALLLDIDHLLHGLKPRVREAFLLSQVDGLSYRQIAAHMKLPLDTVQRYMTCAFEHCYRQLAP
ncbi:Sigma-70, region 4 [compost metagenome]